MVTFLFPRQPVPVFGNSLDKEVIPNTQPKPLPAQPEAISYVPVACSLSEQTDPHPTTTYSQKGAARCKWGNNTRSTGETTLQLHKVLLSKDMGVVGGAQRTFWKRSKDGEEKIKQAFKCQCSILNRKLRSALTAAYKFLHWNKL